ncbi:MAG: arylsulfotransferase family protein, partial [Bacteroidia bacterium]
MKLVVLKISKVVLLTATVIVLLFYGIFAGEHHWFPFRQYSITKNTIKTLINKTENLNPTHLPYSDTIKGIWHKVGAYKGDFLVSLINNDNQQEIRLYGANNQLKKQLILDFENIANQFEPNSAQGIKPLKKFSAMFSHGLKMTSSGDLILNIEQLGICKIDFSGKVKWAYQYYTHHSVDIDNNNNIWVCGSQLTNISLTDTITDQSILQLNSNGKVIKSVSIHKILEKNGLSGLLYSNGVSIRHDRFHLNDIEAFKGNERVFDHNHLLISLRNINTVLLYNHIN